MTRELDGPATLAASTLLSVVVLFPDVQTPADLADKSHAILQRTLVEMLARVDLTGPTDARQA